jgi:hypothetical protein
MLLSVSMMPLDNPNLLPFVDTAPKRNWVFDTLVPQTANISDNDLKSNDIKEENGSTKESG